ncbi:MAG: GTP cyclohydrolase I FolE [Bacteriovoracia bacterium]
MSEEKVVNCAKFPGDYEKACNSVKEIFRYLGEDPEREGLKDSPHRIVRSWDRLFGGYCQKPEDVLTFFYSKKDIPSEQIVLLKDIDIYSTCEHHFLPFTGKAHVAYIPTDRIVGISKLARLVDVFARRLQIQERLGNQVVDVIMDHLHAKAAACIIESRHLCMACRGVEQHESIMTTSALRGVFLTDHRSRMELLTLIKK